MYYVLIAITFLCAACSLFDEYGPCPGERAEIPAPDGPPGPGDPSDPGDYGADGARYKRLSDGTVCTCGAYSIGCYGTPEEAEDAAACGPDMWGETFCAPAVLPAPPADVVEAARKWTCTMGKYDRASRKLVEEFARSETAPSKSLADSKARAWADRKNETDKVHWWALIGGGCEPTEGDASE